MTEIRRRDPMVFDLDGDGLETVGIDPNAPILFDHNGDGIKTGTGWVSSDDAFLVLDRNGNGSIDSGRELFGDSTPLAGGGAAADGFAALAAEDTNHDGQVNASDANFANLRLWRDLNQDGVSQSNELITLTSAGIQSINVGSTEHSQTLSNGNQIADLGTYTRSDGSQGVLGEVTGNLGDINLADIPFFNEFTDSIPLTEAAQGLPDIHGSGQVRDLQQAASLDGNLAAMVNGLLDAGAQTRGQLWGQLDQLIALWANTSSMEGSFEIASDGGYELKYIPEDMSFTEALGYIAGEAGTMASPEEIQHLLDMQAKQERLHYLIEILERFNGLPFVVIQADDGGFEVRSGNDQVLATTVTETPDPGNPDGTMVSRRCFVPVSDAQLTLLEQSYEALKSSIYDGLVLETRLRPYLDAMSLNIDENGITMDFSAMENMLSEYRQSDRINAFIDRAELVRYAGTLLFQLDWQGDRILAEWISEAEAAGDWNAIRTAIGGDYVSFNRSNEVDFFLGNTSAEHIYGYGGDDLLFGAGGNDDMNGGDGNDRAFGGTGNDMLEGQAGDDLLDAGEGDDYLSGGAGNDVLRGGDGADRLFGGEGDDHLDGGAGNDYLVGDGGNDTFYYGRGGGNDTIFVNDSAADRVDRLVLTNLNAGDVRFERKNVNSAGWGDLYVVVKDTGEWICLQYFFSGEYQQINEIEFADGTCWSRADVLALNFESSGGSGNDTLYGRGDNGDSTLCGLDGNDSIIGFNGNERLFGGDGSDSLMGSNGNDLLDGGAGDDRLEGGAGSDTYYFGRGGGSDVLVNSDGSAGRFDRLVLADLNVGDVRFERTRRTSSGGGDMTIVIQSTGEKICLQDFFAGGGYQINEIVFADGTLWGLADFLALEVSDSGGSGNDSLYGRADKGASVLYGLAGNDTLQGLAGNERMFGGEGSDRLLGGEGNDQLDGGGGNDYLEGGLGNDTYYFGRGSGQDTINNGQSPSGRFDRLVLTNLNPDDVRFEKRNGGYSGGGDLYIVVKDTGEWVCVQYFFSGADWKVDALQFADGTVWDQAALQSLEVTVSGTAGNETIYARGDKGASVLYGLAGNDTLQGFAGSERMFGGEGSDRLLGGEGNDQLDGGAGNDYLEGGYGNDTYYFGRGSGQDTINNNDSIAGRVDRLVLANLNPADVRFEKRNGGSSGSGDLFILIKDTGEYVCLQSYFSDKAYRVDEIVFADGTVWNQAAILNFEVELQGTAGNETMYARGDKGASVLYGLAGNDTLQGFAGNERMFGGDGNDRLLAGEGNDQLDGGAGNDYLEGGYGNDTYYFGRGSGQDTINNNDSGAGRVDRLVLTNLNPQEVRFEKRNNDLFILVGDSGEYVCLQSYFSDKAFRIDEVVFANGTILNQAALLTMEMEVNGTAGNDSLWGRTDKGSSLIYGFGGDDNLIGREGNDRLFGGDGKDSLTGGDGADVLDGGTGDDSLFGYEGNDILQGREGNDSLSDSVGKTLFDGGAGNDTLSGGAANELFIGGSGNDSLTTGAGNDVILFNKGDGQDVLAAGGGAGDTLSLGGGIGYADLSFAKSNSDLVLKIGATDQIVFKYWYDNASNRSVLNLQMVADAMAEFDASGSNAMLDDAIETFNFSGLVGAFDAALASNPGLTSWSLANALTQFHLSGSDTAAIGGDLAYYYGRNSSLSGVGVTSAQQVINDSGFGSQTQTLQPVSAVQSGVARLS